MLDLKSIKSVELENAVDITEDIKNNTSSEEKERNLRASEICDSLNSDFMKLLNTNTFSHAEIDCNTLSFILVSLICKNNNNNEENTQDYDIKYLASLIGVEVKYSAQLENIIFSIKFDRKINKILIEISKQENKKHDLNIFATALADILCYYTNGSNSNLYSAYKIQNSNAYNNRTIYSHTNMEKIRVNTLNILGTLINVQELEKNKKYNVENLSPFPVSKSNNDYISIAMLEKTAV